MAYANVTDVANQFRKITFGSNTDITEARVQVYLDEVDAEIDTCLAPIYVLPITGSSSLTTLKTIASLIVAARVASVIDLKIATNQGKNIKQEFNKREQAIWARKHLDELKTRSLTLLDAELLNSDYGMSSYTEENDIEPVFDKCKQQW